MRGWRDCTSNLLKKIGGRIMKNNLNVAFFGVGSTFSLFFR